MVKAGVVWGEELDSAGDAIRAAFGALCVAGQCELVTAGP